MNCAECKRDVDQVNGVIHYHPRASDICGDCLNDYLLDDAEHGIPTHLDE